MIGLGVGMGMIGEDVDDDVGDKAEISDSEGEDGDSATEYFGNQ